MKNKDISAIQKQFSVTLPSVYTDLMLDMPKQLHCLLACESSDYDKPLYEQKKTIADQNAFVRDPEFCFDDNNRRRKWPDKYFVIGGDTGMNFHCLNLALKTTPVFVWDHEVSEFEKCSKSITEFVVAIFEMYGSMAVYRRDFG